MEAKVLPGCRTERSLGYTMTTRADWSRALANYLEHGHTGFAWAYRRDVLARHGFYDGAIVGGADVLMAHAGYGDRTFFDGRNFYSRRLSKGLLADVAAWADRFSAEVAASVSFTPGTVLHLWHGEIGGRQYVERLQLLRDADFDPRADLALNADGCWTWATEKPDLHRGVRETLRAAAKTARRGHRGAYS